MEFHEATSALFARDVVLIVGCELKLAETAMSGLGHSPYIVRIGADWLQRNSNLIPALAADVDPVDFFARLTEALGPNDAPDGAALVAAGVRADIEATVPRYVRRFIDSFAGVAARAQVVVGDNSQACYLGIAPLASGLSAGSYINSFGYCTLGYAVPAGIGAAVGTRRPVVCVTGDGALLFSLPELMAAAEQELPLPVIVVDNGGYGEIRDEMTVSGIPGRAVDFTIPDLGAVARGLGAYFVDLADPDLLTARVQEAWGSDRPTVIRISREVLEES